LGVVFFQRRYSSRATEIIEEKNKFGQDNLKEKIFHARSLNLTGKSLREYLQLEADFNEIINNKFNNIDKMAEDVESSTKSLNIINTRELLKRLENEFKDVQKRLKEVEQGINDLNKQDEEHKNAVSGLRKEYDGMRKQILAENFKFGASAQALEAQLSKLEDNFSTFVKLTEEGDHASATDVYEQLKVETNQLKEKIIQIPSLNERMQEEFPEQIKEAQEGVKKLQEQGFKFNLNLDRSFADIQTNLAVIESDFQKLDLKKIKMDQGILEQQITIIKSVVEEEFGSSYDVNKNGKKLGEMFNRVKLQNQELTLKLGELSDYFVLNHNQIEDTRQWAQRIKTLNNEVVELADSTKNENMKQPFSVIKNEQEKILLDLNQISNDQTNLYKTINTYVNISNDLKKAANDNLTAFQKIRLTIEQMGLPGLDNSYKNLYMNTEKSIQKLIDVLNNPKIDLDESQKQASQVISDMADFKSASMDVYTYANLAQQAIRYLTRFNYPQAIQSYQNAMNLYDNQFNYIAAANEAGNMINQIEPNRYDQLVKDFNDRNIHPF
jgi:septation ring formation regulator